MLLQASLTAIVIASFWATPVNKWVVSVVGPKVCVPLLSVMMYVYGGLPPDASNVTCTLSAGM